MKTITELIERYVPKAKDGKILLSAKEWEEARELLKGNGTSALYLNGNILVNKELL